MRLPFIPIALACAALAGCASGNLKSASAYTAPPARHVYHPWYNPWMPYGSANATWQPTIANRWGSVVKPNDPAVTLDRPGYEHAPWATGAQGSRYTGTF